MCGEEASGGECGPDVSRWQAPAPHARLCGDIERGSMIRIVALIVLIAWLGSRWLLAPVFPYPQWLEQALYYHPAGIARGLALSCAYDAHQGLEDIGSYGGYEGEERMARAEACLDFASFIPPASKDDRWFESLERAWLVLAEDRPAEAMALFRQTALDGRDMILWPAPIETAIHGMILSAQSASPEARAGMLEAIEQDLTDGPVRDKFAEERRAFLTEDPDVDQTQIEPGIESELNTLRMVVRTMRATNLAEAGQIDAAEALLDARIAVQGEEAQAWQSVAEAWIRVGIADSRGDREAADRLVEIVVDEALEETVYYRIKWTPFPHRLDLAQELDATGRCNSVHRLVDPVTPTDPLPEIDDMSSADVRDVRNAFNAYRLACDFAQIRGEHHRADITCSRRDILFERLIREDGLWARQFLPASLPAWAPFQCYATN